MIRCNRKGGFGLKLRDEDGNLVRVRLRHGVNNVDPSRVADALSRMSPKMARAITSRKPNGMPPDLELDADDYDDGDDDGDTEHMNAADKAKLALAADSFDELRQLSEGEERKTVRDAIEKRGAQLEAANKD
jgi:hypothetical protein